MKVLKTNKSSSHQIDRLNAINVGDAVEFLVGVESLNIKKGDIHLVVDIKKIQNDESPMVVMFVLIGGEYYSFPAFNFMMKKCG